MGRKKTVDFSIKFYLLVGLSVDEWLEKWDVIKQDKTEIKNGGIKKLCEVFVKDSEKKKCCFITWYDHLSTGWLYEK